MRHSNHNSALIYQSVAVAIGIVLTLIKFTAWGLTNSNAILTDALENIVNVLAGGFGWYSLWLSARPKDKNHPYGHGKIEFVSTGFEGGLIFLAGSIIIVKAVFNLFQPTEIARLQDGIGLVFLTGVVNFIMGIILLRRGKKTQSLVLKAEGKHLLSDSYSSAGLLIGLGLVLLTDLVWLDHILAIGFGSIILYTGFQLIRTALAGIMDEADYDLINGMVDALEKQRHDNWIDVHNFRVIKYGNDYHVDCHLTLPWYFNVEEGHEEVEKFEQLLCSHDPSVSELFIHVDPCQMPEDCKICHKKDCALRKADFVTHITWELDNVMTNRKHTATD